MPQEPVFCKTIVKRRKYGIISQNLIRTYKNLKCMNEINKKIEISVFLKKLNPAEILTEFNLIDYKIKYLIGVLAVLSLFLFSLSIVRLLVEKKSDTIEKIRKSEYLYVYSGVVFVMALVLTVFSMNDNFFFVYLVAGFFLFVVIILLTGYVFKSFFDSSKNKIKAESTVNSSSQNVRVIKSFENRKEDYEEHLGI